MGSQRMGKTVLTAERGESMAVFTSTARRKYGSFLPQMVDAMNRGVFEATFANTSGDGIAANSVVTVKTGNTRMEGYLKTIAHNSGRESYSVDGRGRTIRTYKNERTIINPN